MCVCVSMCVFLSVVSVILKRPVLLPCVVDGSVCVCVCVSFCLSVISVIVKRPVLQPCVVDGRSRNTILLLLDTSRGDSWKYYTAIIRSLSRLNYRN